MIGKFGSGPALLFRQVSISRLFLNSLSGVATRSIMNMGGYQCALSDMLQPSAYSITWAMWKVYVPRWVCISIGYDLAESSLSSEWILSCLLPVWTTIASSHRHTSLPRGVVIYDKSYILRFPCVHIHHLPHQCTYNNTEQYFGMAVSPYCIKRISALAWALSSRLCFKRTNVAHHNSLLCSDLLDNISVRHFHL